VALEIHASGPTYEGFLVIDSIVQQTSSGGVRIVHDLEVDEIRDLAREMSLKYAWCRLPRGGAKSGLRLAKELSPEERRTALEGFGGQIAPLIQTGLYYPGMDLGCSAQDLVSLYRGAGIPLGPPTDTSLFTAFTVASAMDAWASSTAGTFPRTLCIEGFGNVAHHLMALLPPERFQVVALATIEGGLIRENGFTVLELAKARAAHGDALVHHLPGQAVPRDAVAKVVADVFLPAARTRSIGMPLAEALGVRAVIPIANAPYVEGVSDRLHARGILCLPGYVTNCGGVFASSLYDSGIPRTEIETIMSGTYRDTVVQLLAAAERLGRSPVETAGRVAGRILAQRMNATSSPSLLDKVRARAVRRGPRVLRQRSARTRCLNSLAELDADLAALGRR
jgi:glutamate dehydrogenase (NAD(P)+)